MFKSHCSHYQASRDLSCQQVNLCCYIDRWFPVFESLCSHHQTSGDLSRQHVHSVHSLRHDVLGVILDRRKGNKIDQECARFAAILQSCVLRQFLGESAPYYFLLFHWNFLFKLCFLWRIHAQIFGVPHNFSKPSTTLWKIKTKSTYSRMWIGKDDIIMTKFYTKMNL